MMPDKEDITDNLPHKPAFSKAKTSKSLFEGLATLAANKYRQRKEQERLTFVAKEETKRATN